MQGDLETHHGLCARIAERSGVIVVAMDYRLAPESKFPAAVDDCLAAYRWLRERGGEIGADPARIAVGGDFAGGNLSAVVSQLAAAAGGPVPACQVLTKVIPDGLTATREVADYLRERLGRS